MRGRAITGIATVALLTLAPVSATERSMRVDCLPDRVVSWDAAQPDPETRFGATSVPGIVTGTPAESLAYQGSVSVASLGPGGRVVLAFDDILIENRAGPDFIVFENGFFSLPLPQSGSDDFLVFAEPAFVEVSADGVEWRQFPYDAQALSDMAETGGSIDRDLFLRLDGLAGRTPTFTGNWTVANDPQIFDPQGPGGISGAGGDGFDLETVGLETARFVRITDSAIAGGFAGAAEGFDLDAVVVLHGRPVPPSAPDADGDGLSDLEETSLFGTLAGAADSDADGIDDGREVAGCRDPLSAAIDPFVTVEPRLWMSGGDCTEARWTFAGTGETYDLLRASGDGLYETGGVVDLVDAVCLSDAQFNVRWACDADRPDPGSFFVYLVRIEGDGSWGRSASFAPRVSVSGCP